MNTPTASRSARAFHGAYDAPPSVVRRSRTHRGPAYSPRLTRASGFTLHEVLVTLSIVSVVTVGAVSFAPILNSTRMTSQVNTLVADLSLARSEAIKRGYAVTLCQSDSGADCTGASDWHLGWILFADTDSDRALDEDEVLIRTQQALPKGTQVQFGGGFGINHYVTYWPEGSATPNGTFTFCGSGGNTSARTLVLYWTGRTRVGDGPKCP